MFSCCSSDKQTKDTGLKENNNNNNTPTPDPDNNNTNTNTTSTTSNNNSTNSKHQYALIAFGHPLLDMISVTDDAFLDKYNIPLGSSNLVKPEQMPIFNDMASHPENVQYVAGGSSMNTARIVRWILRCSKSAASSKENSKPSSAKKRGENNNSGDGNFDSNNLTSAPPPLHSTKTAMIGAVGDDEFQKILRQSLDSESVDHIFFEKKEQHTGTCAVLVVEGERSLLANLGAATKLTGADVFGNEEGDPSYEKWNKSNNETIQALDGTRVVYMEGFFMNLAERTTSIYVAEKCTEMNKTFAFNLSAPYLSAIFADSLPKILPNVDILFASRIDAVAFGKSVGWACAAEESDEDLGEIAAMLTLLPRSEKKADDHRRVVVITDGANATVVGISPTMAEMRKWESSDKKDKKAEPKPHISQYTPDLIEAEQIVDSNGAGDSFAGGYLAGYLLGFPIDRAVALGHAAASVILKHSGCTFPAVPPFEVRDIGKALPFAGSLQRRQSVFGKSFVLRRKSEAGASTTTSRDDGDNHQHRKSQTGQDDLFDDK